MEETTKSSQQHHVAWADRVGLNKRWAEAIKKCYETYNTASFNSSVDAFRMLIINIKHGPQLKTTIDNYIAKDLFKWKIDTLNEWIELNIEKSQNQQWLRNKQRDIDRFANIHLCNYILQLLEDNGFVFYESSYEEEEKMV